MRVTLDDAIMKLPGLQRSIAYRRRIVETQALRTKARVQAFGYSRYPLGVSGG